MFKLVVLYALVAVAVAAPRPGVIAAPLAYSAPLVAHSTVVGSVPTSVSSQSSTVVHSHAVHTSPVVAYHAAPVAAYHAAPVATYRAVPVTAYHAAPVVHTVAAAPVVSSYSHGLVNGHVVSAPVVHGVHGVHAYY